MKSLHSLSALFLVGSLLAFSANAEEVKAKYDGLTVNANVVLAEGKTLADEVVLFTHGTTTHNGRETYRVFQDLLAESGISSVAPNLSLDVDDRHGEVDCAKPQSHQHHDAMKEIDFWVKWISDKGADSVTLMGHSRGGNQTAWYSVEHDSDLIKKIILVAPQTWSKGADAKDYEKKYGQALQPILGKAQNLVKAGKGDALMKGVNFIYCSESGATAEALVSYYQPDQRMDTPTLLKSAVKPTMVFIGSEDKVVADLADKMEGVNNANVSSYIVEDADHFFLDLFAEELIEEAVDFIQQ